MTIVTKSLGGDAGVYVADDPAAGATTSLRRAGSLSLGTGEAVTAGDVSANGRTVVLRTLRPRVRLGAPRRRAGRLGPASQAVHRRQPTCSLEGQGEALALTRDGRAFYTVPEGRRPALRRYAP